MMTDTHSLAAELAGAFAGRQVVSPPSSRAAGLDLASAYAVESELGRMRRTAGHTTSGIKVGYANKAMWRGLKLDTLVWAHMYDDAVHYAKANEPPLTLALV